jgi:hypothetical protein
MIMYVSGLPGSEVPPIAPGGAVLVAVFSGLAGVLSYAVVHNPRLQAALGTRFPAYRPESLVHQTAVILCLAVLVLTAFQFVSLGGLEGVAETVEQTGISVNSALLDGVLWVIAAFLGVGFAIRRGLPDTLARLGLRAPTRDDWRMGVGYGVGLVVLQIVFQIVWAALAPDAFATQTTAAQALTNVIDSLPLALVVAFSAAVGEEIFMRGALQPVFGLVPVSVFFVALHVQYTLTPIMLFLFVVSLALGVLRNRASTTAAIIAHFVYNALPFVLFSLLGGAA